jgi:hypothetical protein
VDTAKKVKDSVTKSDKGGPSSESAEMTMVFDKIGGVSVTNARRNVAADVSASYALTERGT